MINVLSLFDGMSCGQLALNRAGIKYNNYYAFEIDKYAITVTQANYPNTIQKGSVVDYDFKSLGEIDLLIGGSPCQGFSFAGKQLNFNDPRSALFFEYVRALKEVKPKYFLLENVRMKQEYQDVISEHLGVEPIMINSSLVSAQNRVRLYWTNIPNITQPEDKGIVLKDIIEDGLIDRDKSYCIDANYFKGTNLEQYLTKKRRQVVFARQVGRRLNNGKRDDYNKNIPANQVIEVNKNPNKSNTLSTVDKDNLLVTIYGDHSKPVRIGYVTKSMGTRVYHEAGKSVCLSAHGGGWGAKTGLYHDDYCIRKLTPIECERLQTVPDNYTNHVSNTQRYKMLGNGWTVDVIAHIFKGLKQ
jgi:DNA (cytosine-5)-methyltransferase 3A